MIYLDNSATTKPFKEVMDSFLAVSTNYFGNPSSLHSFGGEAEKLLHQSRERIASLLGVHHQEIIFTSGGTESNNLAIKGFALSKKQYGKHIITTAIEHPSVTNAMEDLRKDGFEITILPVDRNGKVSIREVENAIKKDTILLSVMHVNNETGVIQPIQEIAAVVKRYPTIAFHVDHVQGIGKVPLDLSMVDLCSLSAHKFHGLKGNGILVVKKGITLHPMLSGGNQEWTLRSGTENVAGIVAMTKALRMTLDNSKEKINVLIQLKNACLKKLSDIDGVIINTPEKDSAPHIINFSVPKVKSEVLVHALGNQEIFISTTSACSSKRKAPSKTLEAMGLKPDMTENAIRVSMTYSNTIEEIEAFLYHLEQAIATIKEVTR